MATSSPWNAIPREYRNTGARGAVGTHGQFTEGKEKPVRTVILSLASVTP